MSKGNAVPQEQVETSNKQLIKAAVLSTEGAVSQLASKGKLDLPPDYSVGNAMRQAWLAIQNTTDKNNAPAFEVCTPESVTNAVLSMAVQGLSPDKQQCYFIVYGDQLTLQRSYFGTMAVTKRVRPDVDDIYPDVVYEGDEFEYEKRRGLTTVTKHKQKLENIDNSKICAAYCTVVFKDGRENTTIMSLKQVKQAWGMSKIKPIDDKGEIKPGSTHGKFTDEMCKKTVVNRACKPLINSSDDRSLLAQHARMTDQQAAYSETCEEIDDNANQGDILEFENYTVSRSTGEVLEDEPVELVKPDEEQGSMELDNVQPAPQAGDPGY